MPAPSAPARYRAGDPRSRSVSALLALAFTALVVWLLLALGLIDAGASGRQAGALSTFSFAPGRRAESTAAPKATRPATQPKTATRRATPRPAIVPPPAIAPTRSVPWIQIGRDELAQVDQAMTTAHERPSRSADAGSGSGTAGGGAAGDSKVAGTGPSGETLYAADWYRRPRDSELAFYIPHDLPDNSWGEIACRTAPRYAVTDCVALGEAPPGTGLARKLVEAAWQFRVLPPRVDRRPMVGAWVRIHFDITGKRG